MSSSRPCCSRSPVFVFKEKSFFENVLFFFYLCICVHVCVMCWVSVDARSSGNRDTSSCGLPEVSARNPTQVLYISHVVLLTMEPPLQPGPSGTLCILMDAVAWLWWTHSHKHQPNWIDSQKWDSWVTGIMSPASWGLFTVSPWWRGIMLYSQGIVGGCWLPTANSSSMGTHLGCGMI